MPPPTQKSWSVDPQVLPWLIAGAALALVLAAALVFLNVTKARRRDPGKRQCPACGGSDVRPSFPGGVRDRFYHLFGCQPYRCRACRCRFYRPEPHHIVDGSLEPGAPVAQGDL